MITSLYALGPLDEDDREPFPLGMAFGPLPGITGTLGVGTGAGAGFLGFRCAMTGIKRASVSENTRIRFRTRAVCMFDFNLKTANVPRFFLKGLLKRENPANTGFDGNLGRKAPPDAGETKVWNW